MPVGGCWRRGSSPLTRLIIERPANKRERRRRRRGHAWVAAALVGVKAGAGAASEDARSGRRLRRHPAPEGVSSEGGVVAAAVPQFVGSCRGGWARWIQHLAVQGRCLQKWQQPAAPLQQIRLERRPCTYTWCATASQQDCRSLFSMQSYEQQYARLAFAGTPKGGQRRFGRGRPPPRPEARARVTRAAAAAASAPPPLPAPPAPAPAAPPRCSWPPPGTSPAPRSRA